MNYTDPCVSAPTMDGTANPGMVAPMLDMPMRTPAKLLAMSTWLEKTPENMDPKKQVATMSRTTTEEELQPERHTPTRQMAGITEARKRY